MLLRNRYRRFLPQEINLPVLDFQTWQIVDSWAQTSIYFPVGCTPCKCFLVLSVFAN